MRRGDLSNRTAPRGVLVFEHLLGHPPAGAHPDDRKVLFRRKVGWSKFIHAHTIDSLVIAQTHRMRERYDMTMDLATFYPPEALPALRDLAWDHRWPFGRTYATTPGALCSDPLAGRVYVSVNVPYVMLNGPQTMVSRIGDATADGQWR